MRKYVAEFIGTFVLVLFGCGTAIAVGCSTDNIAAYLTTAIAFGLSIVAMAYSIGNVSGCHINPAVSIAMLISKKMSAKDFVGYVIAQVLGAIVAAALLGYLFGFDSGFGANGLYDGDVAKSLIIEIILTFIFVLVILGVTSRNLNAAVTGLVIGLTLTFVHILGIYFTGTSVNPARSLGPALFAGGDALRYVWVFILAPLIGGALAAVVYKGLDKEQE
ncbi:MAG: MIP family channel protein [Eubacterium sp.]|nr:MIP family channel protein [Eubacterium sp.]